MVIRRAVGGLRVSVTILSQAALPLILLIVAPFILRQLSTKQLWKLKDVRDNGVNKRGSKQTKDTTAKVIKCIHTVRWEEEHQDKVRVTVVFVKGPID